MRNLEEKSLPSNCAANSRSHSEQKIWRTRKKRFAAVNFTTDGKRFNFSPVSILEHISTKKKQTRNVKPRYIFNSFSQICWARCNSALTVISNFLNSGIECRSNVVRFNCTPFYPLNSWPCKIGNIFHRLLIVTRGIL